MNIGAGIFLIAMGAVLAFAVNLPDGTVDVAAVGWIVMLAGLTYLLFELGLFGPRRRALRDETVIERPPETVTVVERAPRAITVVGDQEPWYHDDYRISRP